MLSLRNKKTQKQNETKTVSLRYIMSSCLPSEGLMFQVYAAVKDTGLGCQN